MDPNSQNYTPPPSTPVDQGQLALVSSDRSLLLRFQAERSDTAATTLYLRYAIRLIQFTRSKMSHGLKAKVEAEDIVQSVFRTFFRRAGQGEFAIPDGGELWRLFMVVALNKIRNTAIYHKAAKRDAGKTISAEDFSALPDHSEDGANQQALMFLQSSIDDLLNGLDPIHKRIVELRLEGHEVAHIAQQVGRAKRSVERVLQSFRSELESVLHV